MKKAQMGFVGIILIAFVTIVVGVALFQASAQSVGQSTTMGSVSNLTMPSTVNGTAYYFTNYKNFGGTITVTNATGYVMDSGNWTLTNNVVYNGALAVQVVPKATLGYYTQYWNWTVTQAQPLGYIEDSGARGVVAIILIFLALGIAVVALEPTLRSGVLDMMGR